MPPPRLALVALALGGTGCSLALSAHGGGGRAAATDAICAVVLAGTAATVAIAYPDGNRGTPFYQNGGATAAVVTLGVLGLGCAASSIYGFASTAGGAAVSPRPPEGTPPPAAPAPAEMSLARPPAMVRSP